MVQMTPLPVAGGTALGITVDLPGTRLVIATTDAGYLMCGALDIDLLDTRLAERRIVAGRTLGVRTLDDLRARPLEAVTAAAYALGLRAGMRGEEALALLLSAPTPGTPE